MKFEINGVSMNPYVGRNPRLTHTYKLPTGAMPIVKTRKFQLELSGALKKKPKKVHIWKNYVEFEYEPKSKFKDFRYMRRGKRGTLINIGEPKGKSGQGWRMHHVLIPTPRVMNLLSKWSRKPSSSKKRKKVAANPNIVHTYKVDKPLEQARIFASVLAADRGVRSELKRPKTGVYDIVADDGKTVRFVKKAAKNPLLMTVYGNPGKKRKAKTKIIWMVISTPVAGYFLEDEVRRQFKTKKQAEDFAEEMLERGAREVAILPPSGKMEFRYNSGKKKKLPLTNLAFQFQNDNAARLFIFLIRQKGFDGHEAGWATVYVTKFKKKDIPTIKKIAKKSDGMIYESPEENSKKKKTSKRKYAKNYSSLVEMTEFKSSPFKSGRKIPIAKFEKWLYANCSSQEIRRYERQKANYQKAHIGATPRHITRELIDVGMTRAITDRDFLYDMGKAPKEFYSVPKRSGKAQESEHWVHKWKTQPRTLPRTLVSADGKTILKPLKGTAKVKGGWMDG